MDRKKKISLPFSSAGDKARYAPLVLQEINAPGIYRHTGSYKPTVTLQQLPMADLRLREEETLLVSISVSFPLSFVPLLQVLLCPCSQFSLKCGRVELARYFTGKLCNSSSLGQSASVQTPSNPDLSYSLMTTHLAWSHGSSLGRSVCPMRAAALELRFVYMMVKYSWRKIAAEAVHIIPHKLTSKSITHTRAHTNTPACPRTES